MQTIREVLAIGDRLIESQARERALEGAYARNGLQHVLEDLAQARRSTELLTMEYLDAIGTVTHLESRSLPLQFDSLPTRES